MMTRVLPFILCAVGFLPLSISAANLLTADEKNFSAYASLTAVNEATFSSKLASSIENIFFRPGETFKKDDVLIAFDCEEIQLELDKAKADFKLSEAVLKSTKDLRKLNSASNLEVAKAEGEHERNIAQVRLLQFKEKQCKLTAPYDGETIVQEVNAHETVKIGDPLLTIVNNQSLEVEIYAPSIWLKDIHIGSSFQLHLDEFSLDKTFHGVVTQIVDRIDPASQSALIYGRLQNNTGLFAGMSGVAQFEVNSPINESAKSPGIMSSLLPQDIMSVVNDWSYPLSLHYPASQARHPFTGEGVDAKRTG